MHLLLTDRSTEAFLIRELERTYRSAGHRMLSPGLVASDFLLQTEAPPVLVFSRQLLPDALQQQAVSIKDWAQLLFDRMCSLPPDQPWHLHVLPHYGLGNAGQNRVRLIREALADLLQRKLRHLAKSLAKEPIYFTPAHSLVQLLLTGPDTGFVSVASAPTPHDLRQIVWPFPKGEIPVASDKAAPSRAFAKLLEAEMRLGRSVQGGETCVDLGASPGSWSYVALHRGARVTAVDRAPLRADLMSHPRLVFRKGDAFTFKPDGPVDWLLCDVIAAPERTVALLIEWVRQRRARRFVVTIKFRGAEEYGVLERLKHALPPLCAEFFLTHLCANKNEVCAFGETGDRLRP